MSRILILLIACTTLLSPIHSETWAVLVAGSNGYINYRHQADVFHSYQTLKQRGITEDKIILFAFDDIAQSNFNKFPGKVFNKPTYDQPGVDVYAGVKIDYKGKDVTAKNFLHVLNGDAKALKGVGTSRYLNSTKNDQVVIFFTDHGSPGLIAFPNDYLYADQLITAFNKMAGRYERIVFYLQSCQSGSMFAKLAKNTKIYALSAANPKEPSWGTYCPPDDAVQGQHLGACLGDLFAVKVWQDLDIDDLAVQTLSSQFAKIQAETNLSHVTQWGDMSFQSMTIAELLGMPKDVISVSSAQNGSTKRLQPVKTSATTASSPSSVDSRYIPLFIKTHPYSDAEARQQLRSMQHHDTPFSKIIHRLKLTGQYRAQAIDFQCLRSMMDSFEQKWGRFTDYSLRYVKYLVEACERGVKVETVMGLMMDHPVELQ